MEYQAFLRQLQKEDVRPVYFFYGTEELLLQSALRELTRRILPEQAEEFNKDVLNGAEVSPEQIAEAAMNLPFLAERRLVLVKGPLPFLSVPKSDKEGQRGLKILAGYLEEPNPQCCLVFCDEALPDGKNAIKKLLLEKAELVQCAPLQGEALKKWIRDYVKSAGREIDADALRYLSSVNSFDLRIMEQELQKLLLYCPEEPRITMRQVDAVVTKTVESTIFLLADRIGEKQGDQAVRALRDMYLLGKTNPQLLGYLEGHFRNLILVKDLRARGLRKNEIQAKSGLRPYVVTKCSRQAEHFSMPQLVAALEGLLRIEAEVKSSSVSSGQELLEEFVLELCYL